MSYIGTTKIGGVYLGSTGIAKAYLGTDLVFQKGSQPQPVQSYVTDGLVLWLDGIEKGGTSEWVDKVGGHVFTNNGATFNNDHVAFDGDDFLTNTSFSPPSSGSGTIEVVYDNGAFGTASGMLFAGKTRSGLCFYVSSAKNVIFSIGATSRNKLVATVARSSTSISNARRYENGVAMRTNGSDYCTGQNNTNHIGRRSTGNYYTGKIYCIRIYNRQITEAEMLENLAVDNSRFNLGLTL